VTASFKLTLDTVTHLTAAINGAKGTTENPTVTLELGLDPDAELVKVWGDINPLDPANSGFGETEEGAEWLPAASDFLVNLTTNPGGKALHVKVRDDVGNEAQAEASIVLGDGTTPPTPTPPPVHPAPLPANGPPEPEPVVHERRELVVQAPAGAVRDRARVEVLSPARPSPSGAAPSRAAISVMTIIAGAQPLTRVETSTRVRVVGLRQGAESAETTARLERRDDPEFIAALEALGIL
jgi:hypothetical protein